MARFEVACLVEKIFDSELTIVLSTEIDAFSKHWIDRTHLWPEKVSVYREDDDFEAKLIKIGTMEECLEEKNKMPPIEQTNEQDAPNTLAIMNRIDELEAVVYQLRESQMPNFQTSVSDL